MRILIATGVPLDQPSASLTRVRAMASLLRSEGNHVLIVGSATRAEENPTVGENGMEELSYPYQDGNLQRWMIARSRRDNTVRFYRRRLREVIRHQRVTVCVVYSNLGSLAELIMVVAKEERIPVIFDCVEWFPATIRYIINGVWSEQRRLYAHSIKGANAIIGVSPFWKRWAADREMPCFWLPPITGEYEAARPDVRPERELRVLFMGRWIEREMPLTLLRGIERARESGVAVRLDVIGEIGQSIWEWRALRYYRRSSRLQECVHIHGFVSENRKKELLSSCDISVVFRRECRETRALFPTRLPELMMSGTAMVLTRVTTFMGLFEDNDSVFYISPEDKGREFGELLKYLSRNRAELRRVGSKGRKVAQETFTQPRYAGALNSYIGSLVNRYTRMLTYK